MRVFLADDHPLLRTGLRLSLSQETDIEIAGEASDGFGAVEKIQADPPDIALIDVDMPGISGVEVIRILLKTDLDTKMLVLSSYNEEKYIRDAMRAGADGYILKNVSVSELLRIIRHLHQGQRVVSPYLINLAMEPVENKGNSEEMDDASLTHREKEILELMAEGKSNKEISESLFISLETVKSHVKNILKKLNVKSRVEAVIAAIESK